MKESLVFFGSGPVATESLGLLSKNFKIEAIVTKPSTLADMENLAIAPVHTVASKEELDKLIASSNFSSPLAVLIDFGIIVSQSVIDYFPLGIINSHFSLLPEWRGADPITFAILSGQKQTGVSLMLLVEKMDEGPLLSQGIYDMAPDETTPSLTENLIKLSDALLANAVPKYLSGEIVARPQEIVAKMMNIPPEPTYSRKLTKQDGIIEWSKPAEVIEREIRAYLGWPKSHAKLCNVDTIITKTNVVKCHIPNSTPGTINIDGAAGRLLITTAKDCLSIERLKPAGKKEMSAAEFLRGYQTKLK